MSRLAPIPDDCIMPKSAATMIARAVVEPTVTPSVAARVPVRECGEPLVVLPLDVARAILYDDFPLPARTGPLVRRGLVDRLRAARAALPEGVDLVVLDGWRSRGFQAALREHYLSTQGDIGTQYVAAVDDDAPHRLEVSGVSSLGSASLSFSSLSGWAQRGLREKFINLTDAVWRVRGYGDFFHYCLVAEGAVDIACEPEVKLWDLAPLDILVREAGGKFSALDGTPGPHGGSAVATNGALHSLTLSYLTAE